MVYRRIILIRRDRAIYAAGAALVCALAWLYLLRMSGKTGASGQTGHIHVHTSPDLLVIFTMWSVMMIAMMLPAALPFLFAFGAEHRHRQIRRLEYVPEAVFLAGYFAIWTAFSAVAALVQQWLHAAALLSPKMNLTSSAASGAIVLAAGLYQWTPLKNTCIRHCRSPLAFVLSDWREGLFGAFRMGFDHGLFCLGCCWLLMAIPFAAGVMDVLWMAAITAFILVEKAAPGGYWFGKAAGILLIGAGAWIIANGGV